MCIQLSIDFFLLYPCSYWILVLGAVSESFIEVAVRMGDRYSKPAKKDASRGSCDAESSIQEHNSSEMNVRAEEKDDDDSQEITEQSSIDEVCSTSATSGKPAKSSENSFVNEFVS